MNVPTRLRHAATAVAACTAMLGAAVQAKDVTPAIVAEVEVNPVLVLIPAKLGPGDDFADGCWVRLYDRVGYKGAQLTVAGPIDLPAMTRTGAPWRDWDSAVVGPKASVTVYEGEDFKMKSAAMKPRQRVIDMSAEGFGLFGDVSSLRVKCSDS